MKKIILSILSLVSVGFTFAQSSITLDGSSTNLSGTTYTHELSGAVSDEHIIDFIIHNETAISQSWKITRKHLNNPVGWEEYLCWGVNGAFGNCYLHNTAAVWSCNAESVPADSSGRLSTYVTCATGGTALYRYYVSTDGINFIDSVDLQVTNTLSIEEKPSISVNVAPNPASEFVTVNATGVSSVSVRMVDVLGNLVLSETNFATKKTIDVSRFRNGVYFIMIEAEGMKPITRKVIVRH